MQLLVLNVGTTRVAISAGQVSRVAQWPADVPFPVRPLSAALGCAGPEERCSRVLICDAPARTGFAIPASPLQREAGPGALFTVPAWLRRFGAPPWLAGLAELDGSLALFVDLESLITS